MRKDEIKPSDFCPDCVNNESNTEPGANGAGECCSCCCSCSDTEAESENSREPSAAKELHLSIEQQKKDLLSNLTILQTNREPTSVQQVMQFVEALTHSNDFLRRYNLQEDFCLQCLISEPTCTCCTNGISQLSINDNTHCSCEECDSTDEIRYQECTDCNASAKTPISGRQTSVVRRNRRGRRRRQRNSRHNLPRISNQSFTQQNQTRNSNSPATACSPRKEIGNNSSHSGAHMSACPECNGNSNNAPCSKDHLTDSHHDSCDECERQGASWYNVRFRSKDLPDSCHGSTRDDSDFCEECVRENLPSSSSCSFSSCRNPRSGRRRRRNASRSDSREIKNSPEVFCTCCSPSDSFGQRASSTQGDQLKRMTASDKPECDQQNALVSSESGINQSSECSCEDCRTNSACSDESCDECETHRTKKRKDWNKK